MPKRKLSSSGKASNKKQMSERSFVSLLKKCDAEYDAVIKESTELLEQSGGQDHQGGARLQGDCIIFQDDSKLKIQKLKGIYGNRKEQAIVISSVKYNTDNTDNSIVSVDRFNEGNNIKFSINFIRKYKSKYMTSTQDDEVVLTCLKVYITLDNNEKEYNLMNKKEYNNFWKDVANAGAGAGALSPGAVEAEEFSDEQDESKTYQQPAVVEAGEGGEGVSAAPPAAPPEEQGAAQTPAPEEEEEEESGEEENNNLPFSKNNNINNNNAKILADRAIKTKIRRNAMGPRDPVVLAALAKIGVTVDCHDIFEDNGHGKAKIKDKIIKELQKFCDDNTSTFLGKIQSLYTTLSNKDENWFKTRSELWKLLNTTISQKSLLVSIDNIIANNNKCNTTQLQSNITSLDITLNKIQQCIDKADSSVDKLKTLGKQLDAESELKKMVDLRIFAIKEQIEKMNDKKTNIGQKLQELNNLLILSLIHI